MSQSSAAEKTEQDQQQLENLRTLILGDDHCLVTDTVRQQARELVGEVVAEALHDRQKQDGSIDKVLQPIVESSVERSVSSHSEKLVGYLYPLVGSLVRKAVSAFLTDFIEKTNQLLENSLTIKGLKWRFRAWQAGVSFAQYAASETFIYRVEHLLLIHRETGLLLKAVDYQQQSRADADLISSMLSAINDFVSDSFAPDEDGQAVQLQKVSTDNFTLLIKPGPLALIVAAVSGNAPHSVVEQMQITLEDIHHLYADDLQAFQGDAGVFENAETQLQDCLLAEQKQAKQGRKTFPWKAWLLVLLAVGLIVHGLYRQWQDHRLQQQLYQIDQVPGIIVQDIHVEDQQHINMDLMRDPAAITVQQWLDSVELAHLEIQLNERPYLSADARIVHQRIEQLLMEYPTVEAQWQDEQLFLHGSLDVEFREPLLFALAAAGYQQGNHLDIAKLTINGNPAQANTELKQQLFSHLMGQITATQLNFDVGTSEVSVEMKQQLRNLSGDYLQLREVAAQLERRIGLIVIGASDNLGNKKSNSQLSHQRANNTATILMTLGLPAAEIFATGLGEVDLNTINSATRKVVFNVMYSEINASSATGNRP